MDNKGLENELSKIRQEISELPIGISRKRRLTVKRDIICNGRKTAKRKANMSMTNLPKNCVQK